MRYETLTREHLDEIVPFYIEAFNGPPWHDRWTEETTQKRLIQMMNCEGFQGMVCYDESEIVGMILGNHEYYYDGMHFQIKEFCTDPKAQGKGIGSRLLESFMKVLEEDGIDEVVLLTTRSEMTEGFYQKRGFKTSEEIIVMSQSLKNEKCYKTE
ncbi:MAG: GNAT family N-acetyltransferase [Cellulosilyticaceae bacterium]